MTAIFNVTESTTTVTTVDDVTTIEISTAGLQGASYDRGDPIYVTVRNATGATLAKGSIVYTSGGNGTHTQVSKALATSDSTSARVLGWLAEDIANNASGLCQVEGYLDGINTQGIAEGTQLYLSGTTAGSFQTTKPQAPIHLVYVGVCVKASAGNGRVYVKVQNGYELDELHDTQITSPQNNDVLTYETATGLWKNKTNPADGVTSVVFSSPLTGGTVTSAGTVGLNQSLLSITSSQVSDLSTTLSGYAALGSANTFTLGQTINTGGTANKGLVVKYVSGQSANPFEIQDSTGATALAVNNANSLLFGPGLASLLSGANGRILTVSSTATIVPLTVRGAASQSANLTEWQNSSGGTVTAIDSSGQVFAYNGLRSTNVINTASVNNSRIQMQNGGMIVDTAIFNNPALRIQNTNSTATANLTEWLSSTGSTAAYVNSAGISRFEQVQITSGYAALSYNQAGGRITLVRATATMATPSTNSASLYFRTGTTGLKLVAMGTGGVEYTILDNIV